jgi:hypothetical protein
MVDRHWGAQMALTSSMTDVGFTINLIAAYACQQAVLAIILSKFGLFSGYFQLLTKSTADL